MSDEYKPSGVYLRNFKNQLGQLLIQRHRTDYDIGRMIEECRAGTYWRWWQWADQKGADYVGYPKFDHWCWAELGFKRRKADTLRENYNKLSEMGLDEKGITFSRTMRLGWSKLNQLLRVAKDEETLIAWLDEVEQDNSTWEELKAKVRWAIAEEAGSTYGTPRDPTPTGAVGGDPDVSDAEPGAVKIRWPVVFESKDATEVVLKAHARIQSQYDGEIGLGKALAMMATHYLATTARDEEGGAVVSAEYMVRQFEQNFGLNVVPGSPVAAVDGQRRRRRSQPQ